MSSRMVERGFIRALVTYSKTKYFVAYRLIVDQLRLKGSVDEVRR
jgi:hypothetical protein